MVGYVVGQVIHLPALAGHRTSKLIGGTQNSSIRCSKSAPNSTRFAAFAAADLTSGTSPSRLGSSAGHQNLAPKPARLQQLDHKLGQQHSLPNSPINTTNSTQRASGSNSSIKEGSNPIKARQGSINIGSSTATAAAAANMARHPPSMENSLSEEEVHKLFAGAMPKSEIGALRFLEQYPQHDGRGAVVAIFDTGVDPSAPGLQKTTDGKQKVIDVMDCTGSGDVDTSTAVTADEQGYITGASGRRLKIGPNWHNPSKEWYVGYRHVFELFPKPLQTRVKEERKKPFEEAQRAALATAAAALAAAQKPAAAAAAASSPQQQSAATVIGGNGAADAGSAATAANDSAATAAAAAPPTASKSELEERVKYLQEAHKAYEDPGPIVDCVVWHDGSTWRVALDTSDLYPDYSSSSTAAAAQPPSRKTAAIDAADAEDMAPDVGHDSSSSTTAVFQQQEQGQQQKQQQKGLLADFSPLADYAVEHQYGIFRADQDGCAYAVKVYDNGNTISIVVDAGSHGTHVAGIVAAHFPDNPEANGIAPGAQIISCKIGDSRLGSMETGTGLMRAVAAAVATRADIINMSYGEPTTRPDVGRAIEVAAEAVNKHGVIFVASAGNAGPALSTVGAPGGTTGALLGVGAYISPDMAAVGHSLRDSSTVEGQYTWSSRGPTADGDTGVTFSAPGGANAPVPTWSLQKRTWLNGTSMASPCAAGGIALLLSGLKAVAATTATTFTGEGDNSVSGESSNVGVSQRWISPARIRRAVEATCLRLGGDSPDTVLTYGRGLLQVDAAFKYLLKFAEVDKPDVRYDIKVTGGPGCSTAGLGAPMRGVYMRQPHATAAPATYTVTVKPTLHEDASIADRVSVEDHLVLSATADWVSIPKLLLLHHNGRPFEIQIDPTKLPQGLHYCEVHALKPTETWCGPLFRVPITVIKPQDLLESPDIDSTSAIPAPVVEPAPAGFRATPQIAAGFSGPQATGLSSTSGVEFSLASTVGQGSSGGALPPHTFKRGPIHLDAGQELRYFVAVPAGATWAELSIRSGAYDSPKMFLIRATQLVPDMRYTDIEYRNNLTMSPNSDFSAAFKVVGDSIMELTLSQYWSTAGASSLNIELSFHGLTAEPITAVGPASSGLVLAAAAGPHKELVTCPLRRQRIKPEAKLTQLNLSLKPKDTVLEPLLDPRDCLPGGRVAYRLILNYSFSITESGKYKPCVPLTNRYLYDSPFESQLTQIFDAHKRLLYTGDCSPEEVPLGKGDHTARLMLRHDQLGLLDKLKGTCLVLSRKLDAPVTVPVHTSYAAAVTDAKPANESFLAGGDKCVLWLGQPAEDKLPKDAAGCILEGTMTLGQLRSGAGAAPASTPFIYLPAPKAADGKDKGEGNSKNGNGKPKEPKERLSGAIRDAKVALLKDLTTRPTSTADEQALAQSLAAELLEEAPNHLPLLLIIMKWRDTAAKGQERLQLLPTVIQAADAVLSAINTTELAAFMAMRPPKEDEDSNKAANGDCSNASSISSGSSNSEPTGGKGGVAASYKQQKVERDAEKAALLEALRAKITAQLEMYEADTHGSAAAAAGASHVAATAGLLRQWIDTAGEKDYMLLHARAEAAAGRLAGALAALDKMISPKDEVPGTAGPDASKLKQKLLQQLGWVHWMIYEEAWARIKFPQKLPPL